MRVRQSNHARCTVAWFAILFIAGQAAFACIIEYGIADRRDPELGTKLSLLQHHLCAYPERPLILMLGSSRVVQGFRADMLHNPQITAFNFGLTAAGSMRERQALHYLFHQGVRPRVILVEILPPLLNQPGKGRMSEEAWLVHTRLAAQDIRLLSPYYRASWRLWRDWLHARVLPICYYRQGILTDWNQPVASTKSAVLPDAFGWVPYPHLEITDSVRAVFEEHVQAQYASVFSDFRLSSASVASLVDILQSCQQHNIQMIPILMPEGSRFRTQTYASIEPALQQVLRTLRTHGAAPTIDARDWLTDDNFWDGHHLLPRGATGFTTRLRQELHLRGLEGIHHD